MELRIKVKPYKVEGRTKEDVMSKLGVGGLCFSSLTGTHFINHNNSIIRGISREVIKVVNFEKHNKVVKRSINKKGEKKSIVIKPKHWVGYCYSFSETLLKEMGLVVIQGNQNFTIEKHKK